MSDPVVLAAANVASLEQGAALIRGLDDATFRAGIGPQLRHCLDFHACFLRGLHAGRVDYDDRERAPLLESSRRLALDAFVDVAEELATLEPSDAHRTLLVRSEGDSLPLGVDVWMPSSIGRELQFLLSHTVHHYALVAQLLRERGRDPGQGFGVAPSTQAHHARLAVAR